MHFIDELDFVPRGVRAIAHPFDQLAYIVDAGAACGVTESLPATRVPPPPFQRVQAAAEWLPPQPMAGAFFSAPHRPIRKRLPPIVPPLLRPVTDPRQM